MANEPAQQAAAGVLEDVADQEAALEAIQAAQVEDAAVFGSPAPVVAGPLVTDEHPNEATEQVEQPQDEDLGLPEITWETPDELREFLEAPDFDEDEVSEPVVAEETYEQDEYEDPDKARLLKQLQKAQKQLAWEKEQKVKASRKSWESEARKHFQFADVENIQATSRRAFLREAERQHQATLRVVKPAWEQLKAEKEKLKAQALAEARAEAAERWGSPITGPQTQSTFQDTQQMKRQRLENGQNLATVLRDRFKRGEVKL